MIRHRVTDPYARAPKLERNWFPSGPEVRPNVSLRVAAHVPMIYYRNNISTCPYCTQVVTNAMFIYNVHAQGILSFTSSHLEN